MCVGGKGAQGWAVGVGKLRPVRGMTHEWRLKAVEMTCLRSLFHMDIMQKNKVNKITRGFVGIRG